MTLHTTGLRVVAPVLLLGAVFAQTALAQDCIGIPTARGDGFLGADLGLAEDAVTYGLLGGYDSDDFTSLLLAGQYTNFEESDAQAYAGSVRLVFELPIRVPSVCPLVGLSYTRTDAGDLGGTGDDADSDAWVFPVGIGLGQDVLPAGPVVFAPFVVPQFQLIRVSAFDDSQTETEFGLDAGFSVGATVFGRVAASFTTLEDSETILSVALGVTFGPNERYPERHDASDVRAAECAPQTLVRSVTPDGSRVTLDDDSTWEIPAARRREVQTWVAREPVLVCGNRIVHSGKNIEVQAVRVR